MQELIDLGLVESRAGRLPETINCHTFRATGITAYLEDGGTIENAQAIAAHESPRTTKLYDRTGDLRGRVCSRSRRLGINLIAAQCRRGRNSMGPC